jgi:zinc transport system substrate-binding protein
MKIRLLLLMGLVVGVATIGFGVSLALRYQQAPSVAPVKTVAPLRIVVTTTSLEDMIRNIAGRNAQVVTLLPAGGSPFNYECTKAQIREISAAGVFVRNSRAVEGWADKAIEQAANPKLTTVNILDGIPLPGEGTNRPAIQGTSADGFSWKITADGQQVDIGGTLFSLQALDLQSESCPGAICVDWKLVRAEMEDSGFTPRMLTPDVWLDPVLAQQQIRALADALMQVDPENASLYRQNAEDYVAKLEALNGLIMEATSHFGVRDVVSLEPAWTYFADRYGLSLPEVIEVGDGKNLSAIQTDSIISAVKTLGVKAVFAGPKFDARAAARIASEASAQVVVLDSTVAPAASGGRGYLEMMGRNLEIMTSVMK